VNVSRNNTPENSHSGKSQQRFDEEFKREVVALLEAGRSATKLSRELGVSTWSLGQWKKRYGTGKAAAAGAERSDKPVRAGDASAVALADEVLRLRAELHQVSRQRDILKKALGILSQDPPPFTR
jgi:transposase